MGKQCLNFDVGVVRRARRDRSRRREARRAHRCYQGQSNQPRGHAATLLVRLDSPVRKKWGSRVGRRRHLPRQRTDAPRATLRSSIRTSSIHVQRARVFVVDSSRRSSCQRLPARVLGSARVRQFPAATCLEATEPTVDVHALSGIRDPRILLVQIARVSTFALKRVGNAWIPFRPQGVPSSRGLENHNIAFSAQLIELSGPPDRRKCAGDRRPGGKCRRRPLMPAQAHTARRSNSRGSAAKNNSAFAERAAHPNLGAGEDRLRRFPRAALTARSTSGRPSACEG